jgi:hypothetical protein
MSSGDGGNTGAVGVTEENRPCDAAPPVQEEGDEAKQESSNGIGTPTQSEPSAGVAGDVPQEKACDHDDSGPKRPREDHGANAAEHSDEEEDDLVRKRQKAASTTGESIFEKLKSETEQLIENPEETLGPDLVPPGDQGITSFHDNDVLSGTYNAILFERGTNVVACCLCSSQGEEGEQTSIPATATSAISSTCIDVCT